MFSSRVRLLRVALLSVIAAVFLACSSDRSPFADDSRVGAISLALSAVANGRTYRLTHATFTISGPTPATLDSDDQPDAGQLTSGDLKAGSYSVQLESPEADPWSLERFDSPTWVPVHADLASPNPMTGVVVSVGATTTVKFSFATDGTIVTLGDTGKISIGIEVVEIDASTSEASVADVSSDVSTQIDASTTDGASVSDAGVDASDASSLACVVGGNRALHFGGRQYVVVPDSQAIDALDFTIELWANFTYTPTGTNSMALFAKPYGGAATNSIEIYFLQNLLHAGVNLTTASDGVSSAFIPKPGRWYHIALSYEHASRSQTLYLDGSPVASGTAPMDPVYDTNPLYIGADTDIGVFNKFFVGEIDGVRMFDSALSPQQIAADRLSCGPASSAGMIADWPLDGAGQSVADVTGHGHGGQLGSSANVDAADPTSVLSTLAWGGAEFTMPPVSPDAGVCGKSANKTLLFSGGQYATINDPPSLRLNDLTVTAWVNFAMSTALANGWCQVIVTKPFGTTTANSFVIWLDSNGINGGVSTGVLTSALNPELGRWYQVAYTYESANNTQRLYLDGNLVKTGVTTGIPTYDSKPFYIGTSKNGNSFRCQMVGNIDEVRIWNRALTLAEVAADRHECSAPTPAGLVSSWSFDEGTAQTAGDSTGTNPLQLGASPIVDANDPVWVPSTVTF